IIFYDAGEVEPPKRYRRFFLSEQTVSFRPETIPGGTLQKYNYLLNIVGFRMQEHAETKIRLVCEYTGEGEESEKLAEQRGAYVRNYLHDIWQISLDRVEVITSLQPVVNPADSMLRAELRAVHIESDNWDICSPIYLKETRRFYSPDTMRVRVDPLIPLADVAHCSVEFFKNGRRWFRQELTEGVNDSLLVGSFGWLKIAEEGLLSDDILVRGDSFSAQAVIVDRSGKESRTEIISVPVKFVGPLRSTGCSLSSHNVDRFSLTLFPRNSSSLDTTQQRILVDYCYPFFSGALSIKITGYADMWENDSTEALSRERATQVLNHVRKSVLLSPRTKVVDEGVGSTQPLYSNDLPEGRYYNRTVQILVESPRDDREPWE
ncbi:MAG: OmpA family protein, partial [Candidatus Kapaibacterium sp.]